MKAMVLDAPKLPVMPGHEIIGTVVEAAHILDCLAFDKPGLSMTGVSKYNCSPSCSYPTFAHRCTHHTSRSRKLGGSANASMWDFSACHAVKSFLIRLFYHAPVRKLLDARLPPVR